MVTRESMEPGESDDDATVAMSRREDDATVEVDDTVQVVTDDEATVAIVTDDEDATAVSASRTTPPEQVTTQPMEPMPPLRVKPVMSTPKKRRRRELHPAPVPPGYGERAVRASGVGAISTYRARAIPLPPTTPVRRMPSVDVHRITDGATSVTQQSRRFAAITLGGFAASCVIAVGGLVLIAGAAFGR